MISLLFSPGIIIHSPGFCNVCYGALVAEITCGRASFQEILVISRYGCGFRDDILYRPPDEFTLVFGAWYGAGDNKKGGGQMQLFHNRQGIRKLVTRSIVISDGQGAVFTILPFGNIGLADSRWLPKGE